MKTNLKLNAAAFLACMILIVAFPPLGFGQSPCVTDNFDDGNANGWSPLNVDRWQVSSDAGSLRYFLNTTDYNSPDGIRLGEFSLLNNYKWGDFAFECLAKSADAAVGANAADLCIVFGFQDFDSYYYVNFNSAPGLTALHRIDNGTEANLASYSQATFADGNYHTLRVERTGNQIRAFFDGQQLFSITDSFFGKGEIGLGSFNDSGYFDEVAMSGDICSGAFTDISALPFGVEFGSSAIWGDYDNDGDLDIVLTGGVTLNSAFSALYRNDPVGSGRNFVNVGSPITGLTNSSLAWGDYDNDGDLDILFDGTYSFGNPGDPIIPTAGVLRNDGGSFVAAGANLTPGGSVAWGDFDNDGDLDILLGQKVYRNDGGNFFDLGVALTGGNTTAWGDYDNDGDLDVLAAPKIYRNDGGNFADSNVALAGVVSGWGRWGDYDNDGDLDILVTGYSSPFPNPTLVSKIYRNEGGNFIDIGAALPGAGDRSAAWGDYDNDGDLDILLAGLTSGSAVYRNDNGTFLNINANLAQANSGSVAWGDYDNDGDLDILLTGGVSKIYRNNIGAPNTVPTAPTNLSAAVAGRAVTLSWSKATDNQTVPSALTYNLRIGRTPGGSEIMSPMSTVSSGYRRLPQIGNTNHRNSWTIQNLPPGKYYWSVQAIDNAFAGSAFAAEQSFVVASQSFTDIAAPLTEIADGAVEWGDYDNDGDLDILLTGLGVSKVFRNDNGNFVDIAAGLVGVYFGAASPAAWGDYDNDGDLDILLSGSTSDSTRISIVYRNDAGNFVDINAGLPGVLRSSVAWGDYDNDGDLDILLIGLSSNLGLTSKIFRNDGGTFVDINAPLANVYWGSVAWGDYDNDGDLDILLTGSQFQSNCVAKIYRNDNGSFVDIDAPLRKAFASSVAWGDYDNDGDLDILLTGGCGDEELTFGSSQIYRNDGGNFVATSDTLLGVHHSAARWGDLDNDGDLDILLTGRTTGGVAVSRIYRNDGGRFTDTHAPLENVSNSAVALGDYDNDGDLDLLLAGIANSGITAKIYRNNVENANIAPTAPTGLAATVTGTSVTFNWNKSTDNQTPQNGLTYNLRLGKISGSVDIVSPMAHAFGGNRRIPALGNTNHSAGWTIKDLSPGTYYWSVQAIDNAFAGSAFATEQSFTISEPFTEIGASLRGVYLSSVAWGDYDNDGDLDILLAGLEGFRNITSIYRNDSTGGGRSFVDIRAPLIGMRQSSAAWGDYDNDGDLDVLLAGFDGVIFVSKVYRNDAGNFVDIFVPLIGGGPAAWGDYDNDGDLDILLTGNHQINSSSMLIIKIYRNDAAGSVRNFVDSGIALEGVLQSSAAWGDYDNDGDLDILTGNKVYRNDNLNFVDIAAPLVGEKSAWGDYDNDGDLDILITGFSNTGAVSKVYRNDGGSFVDIGAPLVAVYNSAVAWGDYDNDGDLDILIAGFSNTGPVSKIYRNDGGNFVDIVASLDRIENGAVAWGDYDNDGDLDILLSGNGLLSGIATRIYRNDIATANTLPAAPANLAAAVNGNAVNLSWNKSADNQTAQNALTYNLRLGTTAGGNEVISPMSKVNDGFRRVPQFGNTNHRNSWTITNLPPGTYYWSVQAIDQGFAGSVFVSEQSFSVAIPIAAPRHLLAAADQSKITLAWTANTEGDLLRYRIYRSTTSPASIPIDSVDAGATSYIDNNAVANTTYFYRITAVNQALQESPFSNEVSAGLITTPFTDILATLEGVMGKVAWGDYDNDGDLDILLAGFSMRFQVLLSRPITKLYRNEKGNFVEAGDKLRPAIPSTLAWGDYDNDGDLDILLSGYEYDPIDLNSPPTYFTNVYRNDGGGIFADILAPLAAENGGPVAWGDYDNDGDLDIFGAKIYRNDHGSFVETQEASPGTGVFGDYDNDGDLDILAGAKIYRNDNGSFVDIGASVGGGAWGDYDNDGDLDILAGNKVYRNDNGNFVDIAAPLVGNLSAWGDHDNDGDLDILITGVVSSNNNIVVATARVYRNDSGSVTLFDSTLTGVYGSLVAWGDYDNDGDLDILLTGRVSGGGPTATIAKIYRNNIGTSNTTPTPPANLVPAISGNAATFSWSKSTDNETSSNGLTYNLRVGKTLGGNEVMSPMSEASNGFRRVVQLGNTNHNNSWTLKNLPKAKYYWSAQAIDHAFAASEFAPEQTFVIGDTVWPGDTNNNRLVNQADVLPIGLYWNKTGPKRDNASVIWKGQVALPWSPEAATFADANGDGIVNQADVLPIGLNWGQTRSAAAFVLGKIADASAVSATTPTLGVQIIGDTDPGKTFWLDVHADSVRNLFGLAFELLYAPTTYLHVDTVIAGTWLGNDLIFLSYIDTTAGKISLAVSRKAGQGGKDSSGVIARIKMRMSSAAVRGQTTALTLQNVAANDPAGNPIQFSVINGSIITSVARRQQNEQLPQAFALYPNFPNPFNPSTMIKYDLPEAVEIRLDIFDMLGRHVRTLLDQRQQAGRFEVIWDGRNESGQIVASGVFIYQLNAGNFVQSRKLLLVR